MTESKIEPEIEHLDHEPPCEVPVCRKGNPPAKWVMVLGCGKDSWLSCESCVAEFLWWSRKAGKRECWMCGHLSRPDRHVTFVRL